MASLALLSLHAGCGAADALELPERDASFGAPVAYPRDGGLDGGGGGLDGGLPPIVSGAIRVRFAHAIPNTGALTICHDPDGPGPIAPTVLRDEAGLLRAEFATRSATVLLPAALEAGELSLHREPRESSSDAGMDGGTRDGGAGLAPCHASTREAAVSLPLSASWLYPRAPSVGEQLLQTELAKTLSGSGAYTLLGSGLVLNGRVLDERAARARQQYESMNPGGGDPVAAGELERRTLEAEFGPRLLIQRDPLPSDPRTFSLALFHAVPDVLPIDSTTADREVGGVQICVTAGTRELGPFPKAPALPVSFRMRKSVASDLDPRLSYEFRVFAARDLDNNRKDCSTVAVMPIARLSYAKFQPGRAYTLALIGSLAPAGLCSPGEGSLVRASCSLPAAELSARLEVFEE